MNENLDQKSFWSSETIPVGKSPADMHQVGYDYLEKGTLHGLSDALRRSNGWCSRVFWFSVVTVALICEVIHVTFLLESALQSPTVTNMRYARVQELAMPFLTLCGHPTKLFDSDKLKENNLTLSVALTFASMYGMFDPSVPTVSDSDDEILFEKALKLNNQTFEGYSHSPNSKKLSLFLLNFTIDCENLLYGCQQGFSGAGVRKNCCDNFKPVMTGKGLCYAFDHSTWKGSKVAGVFTGISFYLNHSKLAFSDPVYNKSSKFGVLSDINIAVSNGLEQSPLTNNYVTVASGNDVQITVSTTRIKLLHTCEPNPQLDFYRDYTINNCVWERG